MTPLIHPTAKTLLDTFQRELPQSLLLHGEPGVGLFTVASWVAGKDTSTTLHPKNAKGERDDAGGSIGVEAVRNLYESTRSKSTRRRVVIIDNAERMSHGAQNAFLKLLEEPNATTHFILTSHQPQQLLPTIRSRVQAVHVHPVTNEQTATLLKTLGVSDQTKRAQLQFVAAGLPAELTRLATDAEYFEKRAGIIADARDFLQGEAYQKLLVANKYKGDRTAALQLVRSCTGILRRSLSAKPQQGLVSQLDRLLATEERLLRNQNVALQLARCVL